MLKRLLSTTSALVVAGFCTFAHAQGQPPIAQDELAQPGDEGVSQRLQEIDGHTYQFNPDTGLYVQVPSSRLSKEVTKNKPKVDEDLAVDQPRKDRPVGDQDYEQQPSQGEREAMGRGPFGRDVHLGDSSDNYNEYYGGYEGSGYRRGTQSGLNGDKGTNRDAYQQMMSGLGSDGSTAKKTKQKRNAGDEYDSGYGNYYERDEYGNRYSDRQYDGYHTAERNGYGYGYGRNGRYERPSKLLQKDGAANRSAYEDMMSGISSD